MVSEKGIQKLVFLEKLDLNIEVQKPPQLIILKNQSLSQPHL